MNKKKLMLMIAGISAFAMNGQAFGSSLLTTSGINASLLPVNLKWAQPRVSDIAIEVGKEIRQAFCSSLLTTSGINASLLPVNLKWVQPRVSDIATEVGKEIPGFEWATGAGAVGAAGAGAYVLDKYRKNSAKVVEEAVKESASNFAELAAKNAEIFKLNSRTNSSLLAEVGGNIKNSMTEFGKNPMSRIENGFNSTVKFVKEDPKDSAIIAGAIAAGIVGSGLVYKYGLKKTVSAPFIWIWKNTVTRAHRRLNADNRAKTLEDIKNYKAVYASGTVRSDMRKLVSDFKATGGTVVELKNANLSINENRALDAARSLKLMYS